jgi:hypothetical protein
MNIPQTYYDEVFRFHGQWDMPSCCGLRIIRKPDATCVIVTELYHDNPGTSVTYAGRSLLEQICRAKALSPSDVIYLECTPDAGSKLSFYDEAYYRVSFTPDAPQAVYRRLAPDEVKALFTP